MQQKILSLMKKMLAVMLSLIASLFPFCGDGNGELITTRPEANSVTAYNASADVADYTLGIDAGDEIHDISDMLFGIFFEDINFAADGGLYAEKVINRSFEYGSLAAGDELHGWNGVGGATVSISEQGYLNANNTHFAIIENNTSDFAGIANKGFLEGMAIEKENYDFSLYAKGIDGYNGAVKVRLVAGGAVAGEAEILSVTDTWEKYEVTFASTISASSDVYLEVLIGEGKVGVDMVSLFPSETYKGHGMRVDLAEKLEALNPSFLRFPGGCVIEGWDYETQYNWKNSLAVGENDQPFQFNGKFGDIAARKYGTNIWTALDVTEDTLPCYMSYGLGFFEYFQLAEDLGAVGVPVIDCGLYCQMRGKGPVEMYKEDGTYTDEFAQYLDDMLDLVEFCRGDETTTWGKVRASLGHAEPFELKYICIGNENEGDVYFERYVEFLKYFNAAKKANPELYEGVELIYSAGADDATSGLNYLPSYEFAKNYVTENGLSSIEEFAGATDQHYYNTPDWFLKNTDYYDEKNYSRNVENMTDTLYGGAIKVFVGEYAAQSNRLEAALAEAAFMTGLERNGDIVEMAAYAPLFGNLTATHWAPDLIWFNNHLSTGSINYYVQKLFGNNVGDAVLSSALSGAEIEPDDLKGKVGLGTWYTSAEFDNVVVTDNETGRVLAKDKFTVPSFWWNWLEAKDCNGDWKEKGGKLIQKATEIPYHVLGASAYFGSEEWSNYTYTFEATKLQGAEGFYIPFLIEDENNCFYWNIGGWNNTQSGLQRIENGIKTGGLPGTMSDFTVEDGVTYEIKIVVDGVNIKGYIDGELQFDYNAESGSYAEAYQVVSIDKETGDIIVKLVNVTDTDRVFAINVENAEISSVAKASQVAGDSLDNDNILGAKEDCIMEEFTLEGVSSAFNYTAPKYSVTAIRLSTK